MLLLFSSNCGLDALNHFLRLRWFVSALSIDKDIHYTSTGLDQMCAPNLRFKNIIRICWDCNSVCKNHENVVSPQACCIRLMLLLFLSATLDEGINPMWISKVIKPLLQVGLLVSCIRIWNCEAQGITFRYHCCTAESCQKSKQISYYLLLISASFIGLIADFVTQNCKHLSLHCVRNPLALESITISSHVYKSCTSEKIKTYSSYNK